MHVIGIIVQCLFYLLSFPLFNKQQSSPPGWLSGEFVCPMVCFEYNTRLRQTFLAVYFLLLLLKHVRKVVSAFGKKVGLVLVLASQETSVSPTAMI